MSAPFRAHNGPMGRNAIQPYHGVLTAMTQHTSHKRPNHTKPVPISEPPYPVPAHAASMWIAGDDVYLAFPPLPGNLKGHTVHFPIGNIHQLLMAMPKGPFYQGARQAAATFDTLITQFLDRRKALSLPPIGLPGAPTQSDIFKMAGYGPAMKLMEEADEVRARKRKMKELAKPGNEEASLKEMGLI